MKSQAGLRQQVNSCNFAKAGRVAPKLKDNPPAILHTPQAVSGQF
jgi:hypothetical protein